MVGRGSKLDRAEKCCARKDSNTLEGCDHRSLKSWQRTHFFLHSQTFDISKWAALTFSQQGLLMTTMSLLLTGVPESSGITSPLLITCRLCFYFSSVLRSLFQHLASHFPSDATSFSFFPPSLPSSFFFFLYLHAFVSAFLCLPFSFLFVYSTSTAYFVI